MKYLMILNDGPYGGERTYNGLRLALNTASKVPDASVTAFLMGDAVAAARAGQRTPNGYYNLERMLKALLTHRGQVLLCGSCMDARGLAESDIVEGTRRSTMDELTEVTAAADKVLVF
jgi:uncharacterized protein involved in oxidation of intracellular sulfur